MPYWKPGRKLIMRDTGMDIDKPEDVESLVHSIAISQFYIDSEVLTLKKEKKETSYRK